MSNYHPEMTTPHLPSSQNPFKSSSVSPPKFSFFNDSVISSKSEAEQLNYKKQIKNLEYLLSKAEKEKAEKKIELQSDRDKYKRLYDQACAKVDKLEKDRRFLYEREKEASSKVAQFMNELSQLKEQSTKSQSAMQKERNELLDQMSELQQSFRALQSESRNKISQYKSRLDASEFELRQVQNELTRQLQDNSIQRDRYQQLQLQLTETEASLRRHRMESEEVQKMNIARQELQKQLSYIDSLEAKVLALTSELEKYRSEQTNIELLKEEKINLETRLRRMESLQSKSTTLEVENALLNSERAQWSSFLGSQGDAIGLKTPFELAKTLAEERLELAYTKEQQGTWQAELKGKDSVIKQMDIDIQNLKIELKTMEMKYNRDMKNYRRLEKSKELSQKEVQFLREQLQSYDTEEATLMSNYDVQKTKRIQDLEKLMEEYKSRVKELESQNEEMHRKQPMPETKADAQTEHTKVNEKGVITQFMDEKEKLSEELAKLTKENSMLQKEVESLDKQVGLLEHAVGRGEYNPRTTRVLQLSENPSSRDYAIRSSTLTSLREENDKLINRVQDLEKILYGPVSTSVSMLHSSDHEFKGNKRARLEEEEGIVVKYDKGKEKETDIRQTVGMVPVESFKNLKEENQRMKEELKDKEKRMMRLKEVWTGKALEFREAVYSLLGYKLDFQSTGRVKLTSMYSPSSDCSFHFSSDEPGPAASGVVADREGTGTMQLTGGGNEMWVNSLDPLIRYWVVERGSIPCFLSSVTLDLWKEKFERS